MGEITGITFVERCWYRKTVNIDWTALPFFPAYITTVIVTAIDAAGEDAVGEHGLHDPAMSNETSRIFIPIYLDCHFAVGDDNGCVVILVWKPPISPEEW